MRSSSISFYIWVALLILVAILSSIGTATMYLPFYLTKALYVPLLSVYMHFQWPGLKDRKYSFVQLAYFFALIGDIALIFDNVSKVFFVVGLGAFLVQHFFYIWLHLISRQEAKLLLTEYYGAPHIPPLLYFSVAYLSETTSFFKTIVVIYGLFLTTSFITTFWCSQANKKKYWSTIIGFGLFVISDSLIAVSSFIIPFKPIFKPSILLTYYVGQIFVGYGNLPDS